MTEIASGWTILIDFEEISGTIDSCQEELNGQESLILKISNTSYNRSLVATDKNVDLKWGSSTIFYGVLKGAQYAANELKPTVYNRVLSKLAKKIIDTGDTLYTTVDQALTAICAAAGVTKGEVPTQTISTKFLKANCLDAVKYLAQASIMDFWSTSGTTINIGVRGEDAGALTIIGIGERGTDRQTQHNHVWVKGTDANGVTIWGEAKTGDWTSDNDTPIVHVDQSSKDVGTLNNIAASYLQEESLESCGVSVKFTIDEAYDLYPGDTVTVDRPDINLSGTYECWKTTKHVDHVDADIDRIQGTVDKDLKNKDSLADMGIYEVTTGGGDEFVTDLQGLVGLYHLNDYPGIVAKDSSPRALPVDGNIVNCNWQQGPLTMMLTNSGSGYIDIGSSIDFNAGTKFTVTAWFSPSASDSTKRFIAHKDGQFAIYYHVNTGVISVDFVDSNSSVQTFNSDAGVVTVGARLFVVVTYNGSNILMYINNTLHKTFTPSPSGAPHTSANKVYLGMFCKGVLAEVMLWIRYLTLEEVSELYFFPMFRVVKKGNVNASDVTFKIISMGYA